MKEHSDFSTDGQALHAKQAEFSPSSGKKSDDSGLKKRREHHLLLALSQAAHAVQRARTPEAVYRAIGEQVNKLGLDGTVFTLSDDRKRLIVSYLTLKSGLIRAAEKLTGLSAEGHQFSLRSGGFFQQVIAGGEPVFEQVDVDRVAEALPRPVRPLAGQLIALLGWQQSIYTPLMIGDEVQGLLVITGADLTESDVPAVVVFANQVTIAIENARLYEESQQLAAFNEGIIQNVIAGIVLEDVNGFLTFNNPAAAEMLGYAPDELVGLHRTEIIPPDQQSIVRVADERRKRGETDRYELELMGKDGRRMTALIAGSPRFDEDGNFAGTMAVFTNITELKQTEEALREREEKYRLLVENANEAITVVSEQGELLVMNDAAAQMLGGRPRDFVGKTLWDVFPKAVADERMASARRVMQTGQGHLIDICIPIQDEKRWFRQSTQPIRKTSGTVTSALSLSIDITERKQAEAALRESEERNRLVTEIITDYAFIVDVDPSGALKLRWASENMPRLTGRTVTEAATPDLWKDIIHPDDLPAFWRFVEQLLASGESGVLECRTFVKSGAQRWIQISAQPKKDVSGTIFSIIGAITDITERKQAETALRESEERFRKIFEEGPLGMAILDPDDHFIRANAALCRIVRYTEEELIGSTYLDITHPDDVEVSEQQARQLLKGELPYLQTEKRYVTKDGQTLWVSLTVTFIRDDEGNPRYKLSMIEDITERKRAEEERAYLASQVREQARWMEQILATVPAGVLLLDVEGQVLQANPVAEADLAVMADAQVGDIITHLGNRPLDELLTSPPTKGLWHEVKGDGHIFEVIARPVENGPEPEYWVLVTTEVTREREIRTQLQQQERLAAVGQLAAGIAHDFNNIMATIVLYAQMAARSQELSEQDRERMKVINQQAWHATRLIEQILDFSRRAVLERRPLNLLPLFKEQVKLLRRTLPEHIGIELNYGSDDYTVHADPTRMQQMLTNLAVNARDAMRDGGTLCIDLAQIAVESEKSLPLPEMETGQWVRIAVKDEGTGIAPNVLPHIFEPFFTTKGPGEGSGLGLAQVHGIVGQHGGHIDVQTQMAEGTAFIIYLPALSVRPAETSPLETSAVPQGQGEVILVVEDGDTVRAALVESLEQWNYRTLEATNGEQALALMEGQAERGSASGKPIALILSDVVMPTMGGIALFHALREKGVQTPMILLTGHPMEKELDKLQAQGLSAWLSKPPSLDRLAQAVANALHHSS